jgi:hypothetical protein
LPNHILRLSQWPIHDVRVSAHGLESTVSSLKLSFHSDGVVVRIGVELEPVQKLAVFILYLHGSVLHTLFTLAHDFTGRYTEVY